MPTQTATPVTTVATRSVLVEYAAAEVEDLIANDALRQVVIPDGWEVEVTVHVSHYGAARCNVQLVNKETTP